MIEAAVISLLKRHGVASAEVEGEEVHECTAEPDDLSNMPLRIASVFIILVGSLLGAVLPIILSRASSRIHVPKATFFVLKYVGTGVIIATAWIHLLSPAVEALHDECLSERLGEYDWAFAIGLMTIMAMFLIELLAAHASQRAFTKTGDAEHGTGPAPVDGGNERCMHNAGKPDGEADGVLSGPDERNIPGLPDDVSYPPGGQDHLGHARHHREMAADMEQSATKKTDLSDAASAPKPSSLTGGLGLEKHQHDHGAPSHESIAGQLTSIFILEFGVVFHSIFIGIALATSSELTVLLIVIVFHQTLEGLGLGSRLAVAPWPRGKRWVPYVLAVAYGLSTPLAIAIGINVRPSSHEATLLVQGIFDAIAAGILLYTGLVELMAHEFMFNPHMRNSPLRVQLFAFGCMAFGAGIMALLGKWA